MTTLQAQPIEQQDADNQAQLVALAKQGDMQAFESLYRLFSHKIYLLCVRMTGRPALAEEHMQDAFIKAWQALPSFEGNSKFSTWVYRIAVNVVLNEQRKNHIEIYADQDWQQAFEDELSQTHHPQQIDLEKAIVKLPAQARNVLLLHDLMGMTHEEVGDTLGIASGTCKAHLSRARVLLKEQLDR